MASVKPKRGDVWWIVFDPARGTEVQKQRPAVVMSNDISNRYLDRFQVVPLTSNTSRVYASECLVQLKQQTGKAMADQVRTVSRERFGKKICTLRPADVAAVASVLRLQLGLD